MVLIVLIASLLGAAVLGGRWWWKSRNGEHVMHAPTIACSLLLVVAVIAGTILWRHEVLENRLSVASARLISGPADVNCQSLGGQFVDAGSELGYVAFGEDGVPERATLIKGDVCNDLRGFPPADDEPATSDQVVAVHILTHEAMHMSGTRAESITECQAVQRDVAMARLLGASEVVARDLARRYWTGHYPRQGYEYLSGDCGDGRPLDENLPDAPWDTA